MINQYILDQPFLWQKKIDHITHWILVLLGLCIPLSIAASNIAMVSALILTLIAGNWRKKFIILKTHPITKWILAFTAMLLIGCIYSTASSNLIFDDVFRRWHKIPLILFFLPFFINKEWRNRGINAFLIACSIVLFLSYVKFFYGPLAWFTIAHNLATRPDSGSVINNHITQSYFFSIATYLFLLKTFDTAEKKYQYFFGLMFLLFMGNMLIINTGRTGDLMLIMLLLLAGWQLNSKHLRVYVTIAIGVLLALAIFVLPTTWNQKTVTTATNIAKYDQGEDQTSSVGLRFTFYQNSLKLIREKPLFGWGTGNFKQPYYQHFGLPGGWTQPLKATHNGYLIIVVEFGLIGLLVYFGLFFSLIHSSRKITMHHREGLAYVLAVMVGNTVGTMLYVAPDGYLFTFLISLFFAGYQKNLSLSSQN